MSRPVNTPNSSTSDFEKQRSLLIQQISHELSSLTTNIEALNRVFDQSLSIGKEFDDLGRLWKKFYSGLDELKQQQREGGAITSSNLPSAD
ncbi:DASH complex subunit DAD1 [Spathaspora sp. JA1]|nr:DASH complex subunit DAD1 [Spathaspora sp. JA1]